MAFMAKKIAFSLLFKYNIFFVFSIYFFIRLLFLTNIPIFNDESIYLDWGWKEIHNFSDRYYSLIYGNQPLLMWIFGIFQSFLSDPLFAGRIVSVIFGFFALLGIYFIAKQLFNQIIATQASIFYIIIPLFSFFDRQALMESAIGAAGIWAFYLLVQTYKKQQLIHAALLGLILGAGFFIKSSVLIFILAFLIFSLVLFFLQRKKYILMTTLIAFFFFFLVSTPLLRQPLFWETFSTILTTRSLSSEEFLSFPLDHWVKTFVDSVELGFWHITPVLFIFGIIGFVLILFKESGLKVYVTFWFLLTFSILILVAKDLTPRYITPFLPFFSISSSYFLYAMWTRYKKLATLLFITSVVPSVWLSIFQVVVPLDYFYIMNTVTKFSQKNEYVSNWPSGYGVKETCGYLKSKVSSKALHIAVRIDSGNPENAIFTCFNKSQNIKVSYFDSGSFKKNIVESACIHDYLTIKSPDYFISRDNQLGGLERFLKEEKKFYKPEGKSYIGVYKIKSECKSREVANI